MGLNEFHIIFALTIFKTDGCNLTCLKIDGCNCIHCTHSKEAPFKPLFMSVLCADTLNQSLSRTSPT